MGADRFNIHKDKIKEAVNRIGASLDGVPRFLLK
jgi:hypothetical protein